MLFQSKFARIATVAHIARRGLKTAFGLRAKMPHGFLRSFLAEANRVWFEPPQGQTGIPDPGGVRYWCDQIAGSGRREGDEEIPGKR
jgi:hypothetical protein